MTFSFRRNFSLCSLHSKTAIACKFLVSVVSLVFNVVTITFDCELLRTFIVGIGDIYTCEATVSLSSHSTLESVSGVHLDGHSNYDVGYLRISQPILQYPQLLYLGLSNNEITSLDRDLFSHTPQFAYFTANRIEHIGYDLVTKLNDLTNLGFFYNVCITQQAISRAKS